MRTKIEDSTRGKLKELFEILNSEPIGDSTLDSLTDEEKEALKKRIKEKYPEIADKVDDLFKN